MSDKERAEKYARLLVRLRDCLDSIVDGIEDEGDRCYFGSTNDADDLRKLWQELDALKWDRIIAASGCKRGV